MDKIRLTRPSAYSLFILLWRHKRKEVAKYASEKATILSEVQTGLQMKISCLKNWNFCLPYNAGLLNELASNGNHFNVKLSSFSNLGFHQRFSDQFYLLDNSNYHVNKDNSISPNTRMTSLGLFLPFHPSQEISFANWFNAEFLHPV